MVLVTCSPSVPRSTLDCQSAAFMNTVGFLEAYFVRYLRYLVRVLTVLTVTLESNHNFAGQGRHLYFVGLINALNIYTI